MKILHIALMAAVAMTLGACSGLKGLAEFNAALVPQLKPMQVGIAPAMKCSDLAAKVAASGPLEVAQIVALYTACEQMQDGQKLDLDPQGARKVLDQALTKPPVPGLPPT